MPNTYLSVPFHEKDQAKALGARWDTQEKKWYAPKDEKVLIERWPLKPPITQIVGENRFFAGNTLFVDLVPRTCWFTNVRYCIDELDWARLRDYLKNRTDNTCECCKAKGEIEAHERWSFNAAKKIQKLERIVALCPACHEVTHMGLAQVRGRGDIAKAHLMRVTKMNARAADQHIDRAFELWGERNKIQWQLDLSIITNSGITLKPPPAPQTRVQIAQDELRQLTEPAKKRTATEMQQGTAPYPTDQKKVKLEPPSETKGMTKRA